MVDAEDMECGREGSPDTGPGVVARMILTLVDIGKGERLFH